MVTSQVDRRSRAELEGTEDASVVGQVERAARAKLDRDYPKPDAAYVMEWQRELETRFQPYWGGRSSGTTDTDDRSTETVGGDSLQAIRDMRYGRDQLPAKLRRVKTYAERIRTGLSHNEIDRVVSLMGRNPLKVEVPAASSHQDATDRAQRQTRFCTKLPMILDKQAPFPVIQRVDDAMVEAGLVGIEFFLTGAYDDISDTRDTETESQKQYNDRLSIERRKRKLPFGIRYVDPASLMFEIEGDEVGMVLIVEKKRWRHVKRVVNRLHDSRMRRLESGEDIDPDLMPNPGDRGYSNYIYDGKDTGDVITCRYYDKRWYCYVVNGVLVDIGEHGFPMLPVGLGMSRLTSAPDYSEMFQGITWGRTGIEQALNDWATMEQDKRLTFGRPKPIATSVGNNPALAAFTEGLQPKSVDLSGDDLIVLPPGYGLANAFQNFASDSNDPLGQFLLSVWERGGMSGVLQGDSPGADPSGYLMNSLQGAANAKYEGLLDNKGRLWEWVVDMARFTIRDLIGEPVEIAVPGTDNAKGGKVTWLSLGPDDIDDTPCTVYIDPMTDTNRMAVTGWYMQGRQAGLVPDEIVQRRAYGAEDADEWNDLITKGLLRQDMRQRAIIEAKSIIEENAQARAKAAAPNTPPVILGPDGQPLGPSGLPPVPPDGGGGGPGMPPGMPPDAAGMPPPPQPPTVGAGVMAAQDSGAVNSSWTAGQRPIRQGLSAREAAGG